MRSLSFPEKDTTSSRAHPASNAHRSYFPRVKWTGLDDDHSPPPTAGPRNDRRHTSSPSICLLGVNRNVSFLGALAKLRKAAISTVMSVRPSVRKNSAPNGRIFIKFDIWGFFKNLCTCIFCALYSLNRVFVLFRLCIFILICFVCTSGRTTATERKLICSK
jgi:hypothetical protein